MAWPRRLLNLFRSRRLSRDLDRELAFHIAERTDSLVAEGMSEADARREARRRFGNYGMQKERTRDVDVLVWLQSLAADVRYAARSLRASPGFTFVAILSLALGIGANTAIFSLIDAVMLKYLPVSHPEQLLMVTRGKDGGAVFTNPLWEQLRDGQDVFSGVFAVSEDAFDLSTGGEAHRVLGNLVSGDFFSTLGVGAALGRTIVRSDDWRGCPGVAVLSYGFWEGKYGGDAGVIGKTISLGSHPFQIVGVAPPGFFGVEVGRSAQVYAPLCARAILQGAGSLDRRSSWFLHVIARPKPGLTAQQIRARLEALAPGMYEATLPPDWRTEQQQHYLRSTFDVEAVATGFSSLRRQYRGALLALMAVVGIVLLIACANVANLLLARATARQREIAIRLALGAGRARLIRQLLTESLLLSIGGAALGLLFALWGSRVLVGFLSTIGGFVSLDTPLDPRILGFTMAVAIATAVLFGFAPAWRGTRVSPQAAMKSGGRGIAGGHSRLTLGKALVVAQVALSLVLVMGAGLLLGSFRSLATLDPGFQSDRVLLASADLGNMHYTPERQRQFYRDMLGILRETPGVRTASASQITPISGSAWNNNILVDGFSPGSAHDALVFFNEVSDGYFATLGTPMLAGRDFNERDTPGSAQVAIVNETFARKFFGGASPLGKQFRVQAGKETGPPVAIVGVVGDAKYQSLREKTLPTAYVPISQQEQPGGAMTFELRATTSPAMLIPGVTSAFAEVNPHISLEFVTLSDQVAHSLTRERLLATLSSFFGALALALSMIGLYGVMSYTVARRRNEIGIRIALGAARTRVLRLVLGDVGVIVTVGLVIGMAAALATTRLVSSFLFGVTASDPVTLLVSALILLTVALAAGALPAWRAARMDPTVALREE